jgi:hypothetical protein
MRLLADENFNGSILRGLKRNVPELDIVRVQDTPLYKADDIAVLEFAARENRILLTHDVNTMNKHAYDRVNAALPLPGVFQVPSELPIGQAIEELTLICLATDQLDWADKVTHLPLK